MRRICAAVAVAVGAMLLVAPLTMSLFDRTTAAQRLTDRIRPAMTTQALEKLRGDFNTGRAAGLELIGGAMPALAQRLGQTPEQFNASLQGNYPDVADGFRQFPTIATKVDGVLTLFEKDRAEFHAADTIPVEGVPFTVGPWLMVLLGLTLIAGGLVTWRRGATRPIVALAAVGVILAFGPVAVSFPQKTSQAASLVDDLRPLITRPTADAVKGWQLAMEKMTAQLQGQLLPDIAGRLGTTPAGLSASLAPDFPAAATGLPRLDAVFTDFADKTHRLDGSVADFGQTKQIPYRTLPWLFIAPGAVLALCAGAALVIEGKGGSPGQPDEAPVAGATTSDAEDIAAAVAMSGA